jgi:hypothetical protein
MENLEVALKGRVDTKANKILLSFFLALILVLVGVRLWFDAQSRAVPFPNQLAAAAIAAETYYILKKDEPFNHDRYVKTLNDLPKLPE